MRISKKLLAGLLAIAMMLGGVVAMANPVTRTIEVVQGGINLVVNGTPTTPRDAAGNVVEPFIYQGTTFLPVRAVADALNLPVQWDGATSTVYLGTAPGTAAAATTMLLFERPATDIGNTARFNATGNENVNTIRFGYRIGFWWGINIETETIRNHVVYALDGAANTRFTGSIVPMELDQMTKVYRILGDGRLLYTSPLIHSGVSSVPIDIDVSGVMSLRIEVEITNGIFAEWGGEYRTINNADMGGIQNATITTR